MLPHNHEAEQGVLGAILLDNAVYDTVSALLKPDDFYLLGHAVTYRVIGELLASGRPADPVTIMEMSQDQGAFEYLSKLIEMTPSATGVLSYAQIVREKSMARQLMAIGTDMQSKAQVDTPKEVIEATSQKLHELGATKNDNRVITARDLTRETMKFIEHAYKHQGQVLGIQTGYEAIDNALGGLQWGDYYVVGARPSMGKAQPLDAQVLTPRGFVRMGDIKAGDAVIGSSGSPVRVVGVYPQGQKQAFRLTFSDGSSTECCGEHLWFTQTKRERVNGERGSVKTTTQIRETLRLRDGNRANHHLPTVGTVTLEPRGATLLDPWLMGILLADGDLVNNCVRICNPESDIRARASKSLLASDEFGYDDGVSVNIKRRRRCAKKSETALVLEHYGLLGSDSFTKFIPDAYLFASIEERTELLRGLMDADGFVTASGHSVEYTTSSERLRDGVQFLARSLGGIVSCAERTTTYTYKGEKRTGAKHWRMVLRFPVGLVPVSSEKHLAKWQGQSRALGVAIESIEPTRVTECQCIKVDAVDSLYVTDGFVVTHNTAFLLAVMKRAAIRHGHRGVLFELEMSKQQLGLRIMASESGVDMARIKRGMIGDSDWVRLARGAQEFSQAPITIDDTAGNTLSNMRRVLRRVMSTEGKVDIVGVDYVQLMRSDRKVDNREREISEFSQGLKNLAKDFGVAVLALSQLNRDVEKRADKRPMMADLRESGSLEQDADSIAFLYRDEVYNKETPDKHVAEVIFAKNRNGPIGTVKLRWDGETQRFETLETRQ
jgi:replicative DNA helicase